MLAYFTLSPYDSAVIFGSERGATSAEYAIMLAAVAAVIVVVVTALGNTTLQLFDPVGTFFQTHH
ncbi:MAG: Flp family type IVb pilin [Actinobacteria bacterium HGW-Actinobacteria-2]|nr:MAG: Flp family type IVb pilin [Actinobacteria bacterium HGW-Actinobacteria-2]